MIATATSRAARRGVGRLERPRLADAGCLAGGVYAVRATRADKVTRCQSYGRTRGERVVGDDHEP